MKLPLTFNSYKVFEDYQHCFNRIRPGDRLNVYADPKINLEVVGLELKEAGGGYAQHSDYGLNWLLIGSEGPFSINLHFDGIFKRGQSKYATIKHIEHSASFLTYNYFYWLPSIDLSWGQTYNAQVARISKSKEKVPTTIFHQEELFPPEPLHFTYTTINVGHQPIMRGMVNI